jgi:hypothetical protein
MPYCPQCGIDNPATARYCDQCGAALIPVTAAAAPTSPGLPAAMPPAAGAVFHLPAMRRVGHPRRGVLR